MSHALHSPVVHDHGDSSNEVASREDGGEEQSHKRSLEHIAVALCQEPRLPQEVAVHLELALSERGHNEVTVRHNERMWTRQRTGLESDMQRPRI